MPLFQIAALFLLRRLHRWGGVEILAIAPVTRGERETGEPGRAEAVGSDHGSVLVSSGSGGESFWRAWVGWPVGYGNLRSEGVRECG